MATAIPLPARATTPIATGTQVGGINLVVPATCRIAVIPLLIAVDAGTASSTVSIKCTTTTLFNIRLEAVGGVSVAATYAPLPVTLESQSPKQLMRSATKPKAHLDIRVDTVVDTRYGGPMTLAVSAHNIRDASVTPEGGPAELIVTLVF